MSLNTKLVLPVALGLSLVSVTAFVIYYVFKKDEEEPKDGIVKSSRVNVIEVQVQKSIVPALIGRSGSNIKDIEKKTGALIHFKKFSDKDYDVCIIRGRREAAQLAETIVYDFIKEQPVIVDDVITVPSWACGRIIGTGGENINNISHRSGARVKLSDGPGDNGDKTVTFKGTTEQIEKAKAMVQTSVAQEKCRREIEQSKRSPRHAQSPQPPQSPQSPRSAQSPVASEHSDELTGTKRTKCKKPVFRKGTGAPIEVYVSAVSSPSRFWVQLVGPQVTQLDELVNHMTDFYGSKANRDSHQLTQVSIGQVVAAVFRHDGRWYRARVDDVLPNEFDSTQQVADVFFVDYGDSEYVACHELCELRADLLRLRFQAMECFLAGVRPAGVDDATQRWDPHAVERFEELTQVARWKTLVSRTCTYKKTAIGDGDKEKEIPGIKLFDVTEEGELDIGATLIEEGWASAAGSPRSSPPRPAAPRCAAPAPEPFGDLGHSMVLSVAEAARRSSSVPKDHKDDRSDLPHTDHENKENELMTSSKSLASGLASSEAPKSISNFNITYTNPKTNDQAKQNGSHDFINSERLHLDKESTEQCIGKAKSPIRDDLKANMNRIDSHHGNLEALGKSSN